MDPLEAFYQGIKIQRKVYNEGTTSGRIRTEYETPTYKKDVIPEKTLAYAEPFMEILRDAVWNRFVGRDVDIDRDETTDIYSRYDFNRRLNAPVLPIERHREKILKTIFENPVVVLRGPTGCGKTTKVPQFILDDYKEKGLHCNIVVAQPRRIAASTNAKRVCRERAWTCGGIVGYQVGSDHRQNCSNDTRILFCTTGVLVESLLHAEEFNPLDKYTHIILDEVHERDKEMDFLMIAIYKYLNPKIRIVMMSATIDTDKFASYYHVPPKSLANGTKAPVINLEGNQRNFNVMKAFLSEIEDMEYAEDIKTPVITEQMYRCALRLVLFFERNDREQALASGISEEEYAKKPRPSVLIFLPGIFEIKQMYERLNEWAAINPESKILRYMMHSTSDPLQSEMVMLDSDLNIRKVILATNIAESSITVPDVKYVIDFCLTKTLVMNPMTDFPSLQLAWASRDNCEQRAGRTGRVMDGWCFRLVSKKFYFEKMRQSAEAEMVTSPLENIILKTKQLNLGSPEEVLALAMDKPYLDEIHNTVLRLKEMGAMLTTVKKGDRLTTVPRDGDITYIGHIMSSLPIEVKLSKMIALGYCFGVLDECIIIACALNCSRGMFRGAQEMNQYTKMLEFADGSGSDLFALINAYRTWKRLRVSGKFGNIKSRLQKDRNAVKQAERKWADKNYLDASSLRECDEHVKDLRIRVERMNLIDCTKKSDVIWTKEEKYIVLKVVIAGSFYPYYFSRATKTGRRDLEVQSIKDLGGRDPNDTVYFTGFEREDLPHIYFKTIRDSLIKSHVINENDAHNVTVSHDGTSEKVFISFKKNGKEGDIKEYGTACQPGCVLTEVYKSVKLRKMCTTRMIDVLSDREVAFMYAHNRGLDHERNGLIFKKDEKEYKDVCYPKRLDKYIEGFISHTENCGRFWFQPSAFMERIRKIDKELNNPNADLEPFKQASEIKVGQVLAALFQNEYFRAKVLFITKDKDANGKIFGVRFIDFGNIMRCSLVELKRLRGVSARFMTIAPSCFLCSLAFVQPSCVRNPTGVWSLKDNQMFTEMIDGVKLTAEVYSVVNGIVRVFLHSPERENINSYLIEMKVAQHCEESHMSKSDHIEREMGRNEETHGNSRNFLTQGLINHLQEEDIPVITAPTRKDGQMHAVTLKGPFSPLEIGLYGLTNNLSGIPQVDPQSVNHILLENEPNDMSEKYLVAVIQHQSEENSVNTLRQTTMMPNIRGFGPIMAAIFAPQMRLLRDKEKTHYIKMMTGLDLDGSVPPVCLSMLKNMKFDLDVEIKNSDIETINSIRSGFNQLLSAKCFKRYTKEKVVRTMEGFQKDLIGLLAQKRLLLGDEYGEITWSPYKPADLERFTQPLRKPYSDDIFRPHEILRLYNPTMEYLIKMQDYHDELEKKRFSTNDDPTARSERCLICKIDIERVIGIRHHLLSRQHKDGIKAIKNATRNI